MLKTAGEREAGVACPHCRAHVTAGEPVMQCRACGTAHHARCWDTAYGCGSYACAPARRDLSAPTGNGNGERERIRISEDDLRTATPQPPRLPAYSVVPAHVLAGPAPDRRVSRLAIAGLVCAILGIPLFGLLTGAVAVVLCCLALGEIARSGRKGTGLALGGLVLGIGDIVGWIVLIVVMFDGGGSGGGAPVPAGKRITEEELKALPAPIAQAMRANVLIRVSSGWGGGLGSGVIVELAPGQAKILTNRHVVEASSSIGADDLDPSKLGPVTVDILGQPPAQGRVVWVAPRGIDLALVTVPCTSPTAAAANWTREKPLRVGDAVFAIGNPHGWEWSHSQGSVSQFRQQNRGGRDVTIIQTTVPINPGNSGGGLYDAEGTLIGVNTWTGDKRVSEGLSFAISLDVLPDLTPAPPLTTTHPAKTTEGTRP